MRFLFVDKIVQLSPGEFTRGIKHVTEDDYYLHPDEHGRPYFMTSFIGETLGQLTAWNVMYHHEFTLRPVAGIVPRVCSHRPVYVGETLLLESMIDSLDEHAVQYHSTAYVNSEPVFSIEGALGPLLPMDDFISQKAIRQQFSDVYRPGNWEELSQHYQNTNDATPAIKHYQPKTAMVFDRVIDYHQGLSITAEKRISHAASYFADHFPKKPVLPMTVLLECKLNLARQFIQQAGYPVTFQFKELKKSKMNEFVYPGDVLICQANVKQQSDTELVLSFRSTVDGKRVCVTEAVFSKRG